MNYTRFIKAGLATAILSIAILCPAQTPTLDQNKIIREQLVVGGDLYMVASMSEFMEQIIQSIDQLKNQPALTEDKSGLSNQQLSALAQATIDSLQLEKIKGVGKSLHTREDGLREIRTFLLAEPVGLLSLFDTTPFDPSLLTYAPANADFVSVININTSQILPLLEQVYNSVPNQPETFEESLNSSDITREQFAEVLAIADSPIIVWMSGWQSVSTSPTDPEQFVFTPEPKAGFAIQNFTNVEFFESTLQQAEGFTKIEDDRFLTAYSYTNVEFLESTILIGVLKNNTLYGRLDNASTFQITEQTPFAIPAMIFDSNTLHSFHLMTNGVDSSLTQLLNIIQKQNPEIPAFLPFELIKLTSDGTYFPYGGITYRTSTPNGILWKTISQQLNQGAALNGLTNSFIFPVLGAVAVPGFIKARGTSRLRACQENQSKLDGATQQYMLENNVSSYAETPFAGKTVTDPEAGVLFGESAYIKRIPTCPSGGTYTFYSNAAGGSMSEAVYCTHDENGDGAGDHPFPQ